MMGREWEVLKTGRGGEDVDDESFFNEDTKVNRELALMAL